MRQRFAWNELSLRTRLIGAFAVVAYLSAALGGFALVQLGRVNDTTAHVARRSLPSVSALSQISLACARFRMSTLQYVAAATAAEREAFQSGMDAALEHIERAQKVYEPLIGSADEKKTYGQFMSAWSDYMLAHATAMQLASEGKADEARHTMAGEAQQNFDAASSQLSDLIEQNHRTATAAQEHSEGLYASSRLWVGVMLLGVIVLSAALSGVVIAGVNRVLRRIAVAIGSGAELLVAAAAEGSDSSVELSQSSIRQASALEETSAAMEEVSATTRTNAQHARDAADLMQQADGMIRTSNAALQAMLASMRSIERLQHAHHAHHPHDRRERSRPDQDRQRRHPRCRTQGDAPRLDARHDDDSADKGRLLARATQGGLARVSPPSLWRRQRCRDDAGAGGKDLVA